MMQNTVYPPAETDRNPGWALPTYSTAVQPKTPPPSYMSVVNQDDYSAVHNPNLGTRFAPLDSRHYPVQPYISQDAPDYSITHVPAPPTRTNRNRNIIVVVAIATVVVFLLIICKILLSRRNQHSRYSVHAY